MNNPSINTGILSDVLCLKTKRIMALAASAFLLVGAVPHALGQTDGQSPQKANGSWQLETAEPPALELDTTTAVQAEPSIDTAVDELTVVNDTDVQLKAVDETNTELKAVNETNTELKAVNETNTELKAVDTAADVELVDTNTELKTADTVSELIDTAPEVANSELRVIQNAVAKAARPTLNIDPQLRADLDSQFDRLQKNLETADAFSESLGEDYLSYGLLLKQAGRHDDAREVLINAAHISKINNGLDALEQRPYLAALFDIHLLQGNTEDADTAIKRIIWLEKQHPTVNDDLVYPLALRMGNYYLDQFLFRPVAGEQSNSHLSNADSYFNFILNRYGNRSISELKLPYGELALVNYWRSKLAFLTVQPTSRDRGGRFDRGGLRQSNGRRFSRRDQVVVSDKTFSRAEFYLKRYLIRVRDEGTPQMEVKALLNLGDINLMSSRRLVASQYYQQAWLEAQKLPLDDPLLDVFDQPVALPDFNYAIERELIVRGDQALLVALTFDVDQFGRTGNVQPLAEENKNFPYFSKARRALKKTLYRPVIMEGKPVARSTFSDDVLVQVKELIEASDVSLPESAEKASSDPAVRCLDKGDCQPI